VYVVPEPLRSRQVVLCLEPAALEAPGHDVGSTMIGLTVAGDVVLHIAGGLFSSGRTDVIPAASLTVTAAGDSVTIGGGALKSARFDLHRQSTARRVLDAVASKTAPKLELDGWTPIGTVEAVELTVDSADPRQPAKTRAIGRPRSTPWLWRGPQGALMVDDPHEVVVISPSELKGIEKADTDPNAVVVHCVRALGARGLLAGVRIRAVKPPLEPTVAGPIAIAQAAVRGHLEGQPIAGRVLVRTERDLEVYEAGGKLVGAIAVREARWRADGDTLLVRGPGEQFAVSIAEELGRWLMRGVTEHAVPLFEVLAGPVPAGAAEVRVEGSGLIVTTASEATLDLGAIDEPSVRAETVDGHTVLRIGDALTLRGTARAVAELRTRIAPALGRRGLDDADIPALYRRYHELRTERWLWLVFGPVFVTAKRLDAAGRLPREDGEDDEHLARRRVVAETLIVAEQVRAIRLRFGAASAALPYALLEEEAAWVAAVDRDAGPSAIARVRPRIVTGFRGQVRNATQQLAFAQMDIERAVSRLEPVHYPELRGQPPALFGASTLGKIGLGAAVMLLNPISGGVQIMSALAGTMTDRLAKDGTARVLLDRFGPFCKTSWDLLVDVTAIAAAETRAWLRALWTDLALRDKELADARPDGQDRVRAALLDRITALQRERQRAVEIEGLTIADIMNDVEQAMLEGPGQLSKGLGA
jgi:hypothetical protein